MASNTLIESTSVRRSPAEHLAEAMAQGSTAGTVQLREIAFATQVGVRAVPGSGGFAIAPEGAELAAELVAALGDEPGQVLDLSANRSVLELSGPAAPLVLRKSCPADLHPRAFGVNRAITTTLANIPVLLWRTGEQSWYILPRASFTEHTVHWLIDAMSEFASEPVA